MGPRIMNEFGEEPERYYTVQKAYEAKKPLLEEAVRLGRLALAEVKKAHEQAGLLRICHFSGRVKSLYSVVRKAMSKNLPAERVLTDLEDVVGLRVVVANQKDIDLLVEELQTTLGRVGWGVTLEGVYPLRLQIELETFKLDDHIQEGITKTLRRYRDGDFDGAVTAISGLVDVITKTVYLQKSLGNHKTASYQEKVTKAFRALEKEYKESLSGLKSDEVTRIWNNHHKAVSQAAYVLGAFRREYSDVHGVKNAAPELVQRAIDCAVFIIRSISGLS